MIPSRLLTVEQAANRLGISRFTVRAWLRQRRLPHHRLGRRVLIAENDVEGFLAACRVEAREDSR